MVDLKIENVIAAFEFATELDLQKIADSVADATYNPDQFPGVIYKLKSPKTVTLIFPKGYCVCTGATSIQNAKAALTIIFKKIKDLNVLYLEKIPKINIQNIIISYKHKTILDLGTIAKKLPGSDIEYIPNKFPGLVYHDNATEITLLLFSSGVIVGYGSPRLMDLDELITELEQYFS